MSKYRLILAAPIIAALLLISDCSCIETNICEKADPCVEVEFSLCELMLACVENCREYNVLCIDDCAAALGLTADSEPVKDAVDAFEGVMECP